MKKSIIQSLGLVILIGLTVSSGQAFSIRFGGSLGYYSPSDSLIKNFYGSGGIQFGGFLAVGVTKRLELRAEAASFQATGYMTISKEMIRLSEMMLTAGLRFQILDKKLSPYIGAGGGLVKYKKDYPDRFQDVSDSASPRPADPLPGAPF